MKVGVLSDTHLRAGDDPAPLHGIVEKYFSDCPYILHAGDLVHLDHFYQIIPEGARLVAVAGNMDGPEVAQALARRTIVEIQGRRIGIVHGHGSPTNVYRVAADEFAPDEVDAIVFGHSHQPFNMVVNDVLMFNPGSPTDRRFAPYRSVGMLDVGSTIEGRIIRLED